MTDEGRRIAKALAVSLRRLHSNGIDLGEIFVGRFNDSEMVELMTEISDVTNDEYLTDEEFAQIKNLAVVLLREKIAKSEDVTPYLDVMCESDRVEIINLLLTGRQA